MNPRAILLMLIAFVVVAFASMLYPANAQLNDLTLLKSTPTAQLLPLITANNVSRVRLQKVIGHSVIPRGPYLPYGGITLVFSPKGTYLATDYNSPGTLQIWSVKSGKRIAALSGHHVRVAQAVFTPDENKIITVDDYGNIRIWSLASFTAITVDVHGDTLVVSANGKTF